MKIEAKDPVIMRFIYLLAMTVSFGMQSFFCTERSKPMETRVAIIGILVEDQDSVESINAILHRYGSYILGRMGIPYREKNVNIISIAIDAPQDIINTLSGEIGKLKGVSAKTAYSRLVTKNET